VLKLAALAMAATTTLATPSDEIPLDANGPWWEKITVTMTGDGDPQSCRYESSIKGADSCAVEGAGKPAAKSEKSEEFTKITFERRFSPGAKLPDVGKLHPGDTLLGGSIMALAIDGSGAVKGCQVVATHGGVKPDYGCDQAKAEKFAASTNAPERPKHAYMTILVYGHSEQVV